MDPLSDEILHCENKAFTMNSLSVSSRDSAMIKVGEVTKVPPSHLLILPRCHWAATEWSQVHWSVFSPLFRVVNDDQELVIWFHVI